MNFILFRSPIYLSKPGSTTFGYDTESYPPLGLLYIAGALENDGHKVEIIDLFHENSPREVLNNSLKSSDAVGMSVFTNNYKCSSETAKMIKELNPKIPIIIGGPHCTFFQNQKPLILKDLFR